jgi:phospholipase C
MAEEWTNFVADASAKAGAVPPAGRRKSVTERLPIGRIRNIGSAMNKILFLLTAVAAGAGACNAMAASHKKVPQRRAAGLEQIKTIVVVYAENRGFDHLYGFFPGANGLRRVTRAMSAQHDRDGTVMKELPPVWGGLTARGVTPPVTEAQTGHLPNAPFAIDDPKGFNAALDVITQSPWHLFYQNQMQIDGGKNDKFVALADKGSLAACRTWVRFTRVRSILPHI